MATLSENRPAWVLKRVSDQRRRLEANLAQISAADMLIPGVCGDWTVKDIIAHIMEWEAMGLAWYDASLRGETPEIPGPGLTWRDLGLVNRRIYEKHCERPLEDILADFHTIHQRLQDIVLAMTPEQRETPGVYSFTGGGSIIDWMKAYAAHDLWAKKQIRAWMKRRAIAKPAIAW